MIKTSAPGNIVLFGEHAVLQGETAIGCAINRRLSVTLQPRLDQKIQLFSTLGNYSGSLNKLPENAQHRYSLAILKKWLPYIPCGLDINICSELSDKVGLGSSASLVVALIAALQQLCNRQIDHHKLFNEALAIIQYVQKIGSGLDLATSIYGGILQYRQHPFTVQVYKNSLPLALYYSGYKKITEQVCKIVQQYEQSNILLYQDLYKLMGRCTNEAVQALQANNLPLLGQYMNYYHGLLDALGVCDLQLANMVYLLRQQKGIYGAKISGSGLGDCLVVLGNATEDLSWQPIEIEVSPSGVRLEDLSL